MEGRLLRFKPLTRNPRTEHHLQRDILGIADNINYAIFSGFTLESSGLPQPEKDGFNFGVADIDITGESCVSIALEILETLMRGDLSTSEMKVDYF